MSTNFLTLTSTLLAFIEAAKLHGLNPYTYLSKYGISPKNARVNERTLPLFDLINLINSVCEELYSYSFVSTFVEQYRWDKFDSKILALIQQDNLYTLTLVLNALIKEQETGIELSIKKRGDISSYIVELPTLNKIDNLPYRLIIVALWDSVMTKVIGNQWRPKSFLISGKGHYNLPNDFKINEVTVVFDQKNNEIFFDSRLLYQKLSMRVKSSSEMIQDYNRALGYANVISLTADIIKLVINSGDVSINHVSSIIGIHPRLLQQKLKKLDTSFSAILKVTRIDMAKTLLSSSEYNVRDIAYILAFNSLEAFIHFYKKNEGITPYQWKKNHK